MSVQLNHTIVWSSDAKRSAAFLTDLLGLPAARTLYHFEVVEVANGVSLDFADRGGNIAPQHYAFQVDEREFDDIFGRIQERGLDHWADPGRSRPGEINRNDGGRGVYWTDPDGHLYEIITRPYGG